MAIAVASYNKQFLEKVQSQEPIFNNAKERYGVEVKTVDQTSIPVEATHYWRVVGVHHLTGKENMGNHHIYCDVLDEDGKRLNGSRLVMTQGTSAPLHAIIDKPAAEAGTNFPMWSTTLATVAVDSPDDAPLPSEAAIGIRSSHPDEEVGNTWGHHSFFVVFQRTALADRDARSPKPSADITEEEASAEASDVGSAAAPLSLEETIALKGQPRIIPLNPEAMFYKVAQENKLGERLTDEYDARYEGNTYRAQVYEKGVVYAQVGDWGNVKIIPRTN